MDKNHIIDLLENNLYEQLIEELDNGTIDKELFYHVVVAKYKEWNFKVIDKLQLLNLISEEFVKNLIMRNDNLGASIYMLRYMSNIDDIIANMESLVNKSLKNIHCYNITMGILRNIIIDEEIVFDYKVEVMDLYVKYADYENLCLCISKLSSSDISFDKLIILYEIIANKLVNIEVPDQFKSEELDDFINLYASKSSELMDDSRKLELI